MAVADYIEVLKQFPSNLTVVFVVEEIGLYGTPVEPRPVMVKQISEHRWVEWQDFMEENPRLVVCVQ